MKFFGGIFQPAMVFPAKRQTLIGPAPKESVEAALRQEAESVDIIVTANEHKCDV